MMCMNDGILLLLLFISCVLFVSRVWMVLCWFVCEVLVKCLSKF